MSDCIFCKIIKKEIPSDIVYEDNKFLAFLDITPINKGHVLVVPKTHSVNILDTNDSVLTQVRPVAKKVAKAMAKAVGAEGFNVGVNNGSVAGQVVMHLHLHLIPRFSKDGFTHWPKTSYLEGESAKVCKAIKEEISRE